MDAIAPVSAETGLSVRLKKIAFYMSLFVGFIALLTFTGWALNNKAIILPFGNIAPMNPTSAVCFLLVCTALMLQLNEKRNRAILANVLAAVVVLVALLRLSVRFTGMDTGIDTRLMSGHLLDYAQSRMSFTSAINFLLTGLSLLLLNVETRGKKAPFQYLALLVGISGVLSLLGYAYRVPEFYSVLSDVPMSFQSAFCFLSLAAALLFARPLNGMMRLFISPLSGSIVLRWMVPATILIPTLLGLINLLACEKQLYTPQLGMAFLTLLIIIIFLIIVSLNAQLLNNRELKNQEAEKEIRVLNELLGQRVKERTAALEEREQQLELFIENSPAALAMFDTEMRYLVTSKSWMRDYQLNDQPVIGKTHYEIFPTLPQRWKDIHTRCLAGATEKEDLDSFEDANGKTVYNRWEIRPWYKTDGKIGGIIMFTQVITELVEAELKFKNLVENSGAGVFIVQDRYFVYVNQRMADILGYRPEELIGMDATHVIDPSDRHILEANYERRKAGENFTAQYEAKGLKKDGSRIWLEVLSGETIHNGKASTIGTAVEITERKEAETELRRSEANLRSVFENTEIGYILVDAEFRIISFNRVMTEEYSHVSGIRLWAGKSLFGEMKPERRKAQN